MTYHISQAGTAQPVSLRPPLPETACLDGYGRVKSHDKIRLSRKDVIIIVYYSLNNSDYLVGVSVGERSDPNQPPRPRGGLRGRPQRNLQEANRTPLYFILCKKVLIGDDQGLKAAFTFWVGSLIL